MVEIPLDVGHDGQRVGEHRAVEPLQHQAFAVAAAVQLDEERVVDVAVAQSRGKTQRRVRGEGTRDLGEAELRAHGPVSRCPATGLRQALRREP